MQLFNESFSNAKSRDPEKEGTIFAIGLAVSGASVPGTPTSPRDPVSRQSKDLQPPPPGIRPVQRRFRSCPAQGRHYCARYCKGPPALLGPAAIHQIGSGFACVILHLVHLAFHIGLWFKANCLELTPPSQTCIIVDPYMDQGGF
jgi:hypothetical protein